MKKTTSQTAAPGGEERFFTPKTIVRFIAFIVAVGAAVFFMAYAVQQMVHKEPGWYTIAADPDPTVPHYADGLTFRYDFTGDSNQIGLQMKELKDLYESTLKHYAMLLDPRNAYEGINNLAAVNAANGQPVAVGDELFAVLADADRLAKDGACSITNGLFAALRDRILYAQDVTATDPANLPEYAAMLAELAAVTAQKDAAVLTLDESKKTASLTLSAALRDYIKTYELSDPVLDLDYLRDAYLLQYTASALQERGFTTGYLESDSGLTVALSQTKGVDVCLYGGFNANTGDPLVAATCTAKGGSVSAAVRSFPIFAGEYGYYTIHKNGQALPRYPYLTDFDTGAAVLCSAVVQRNDGNLPAAVCLAYRLLAAEQHNNVQTLAAADKKAQVMLLPTGSRTVLATVPAAVTASEEQGYSVQPLA